MSSEMEANAWEVDTGQGRIRASAYLTILNTDLRPAELAELVGLEPDEIWSKGDKRRVVGTHPFNGVEWRSHLDDLRTPSDHFCALVDRLKPYADGIGAVARLGSTRSARVTVVEHSLCDNVGAWADAERLGIVSRMGASLFFDVYQYDEEDSN